MPETSAFTTANLSFLKTKQSWLNSFFSRLSWRGNKSFDYVFLAHSAKDEIFAAIRDIYCRSGFSVEVIELSQEAVSLVEWELEDVMTDRAARQVEGKTAHKSLQAKKQAIEEIIMKIKSGDVKIFQVKVKADTAVVTYKEAAAANRRAAEAIGRYIKA